MVTDYGYSLLWLESHDFYDFYGLLTMLTKHVSHLINWVNQAMATVFMLSRSTSRSCKTKQPGKDADWANIGTSYRGFHKWVVHPFMDGLYGEILS